MSGGKKRSLYTKGIAAGGFGFVVTMATGFASLWLMTHILGKEEYGAFVLASAWMFFVRMLATMGLDRTLLYRVAEQDYDEKRLVGGELATSIILIVIISSIFLSLTSLTVVSLLSKTLEFDPFWFYVFCGILPVTSLIPVLSAWQIANHRAHVAQLLSPGESLFRVLLLAVVWFLIPEPMGVAIAQIMSVFMAILLWAAFIPKGSFGAFSIPKSSDWFYGLKLLSTRFVHDGVLRVDIIMIGMLSTSAAIAEYAIARRLAELAQVGNKLLAPVFTPRMRYAMVKENRVALAQEYDQNRFISGLSGLALLALYLLAGESILGLFGDYSVAWPVLMILTCGYVISNLYGATGRYLNMVGYANLTLYTTLGLLLLVILMNYWMIPIWGASGAALSTSLALLLINGIIAWIILRKDNFKTLKLSVFLTIITIFVGMIFWMIPTSNIVLLITCNIALAVSIFVLWQMSLLRWFAVTLLDLLHKSHRPLFISRWYKRIKGV